MAICQRQTVFKTNDYEQKQRWTEAEVRNAGCGETELKMDAMMMSGSMENTCAK